MRKLVPILCCFACIGVAYAGIWPFGSDDSQKPRLSELMSKASLIIDDAADLAADGKYQESARKYREALDELSRVEVENPERAATAEFASLRNKRAYVNAAIDTLLLAEARANAKAVAITDTTELEKRFLAETTGRKVEDAVEADSRDRTVEDSERPAAKPGAKPLKKDMVGRFRRLLAKDPDNRRYRLALVGEYIKCGDFDAATKEIDRLLEVNMTDSSALNLRAVCEASRGDFKAAEKTLDLAIQSNPRDFNGYYNMANLKLQGSDNRDMARRYYETGRALGGPRDEELEAQLK